MAEVAAQKEGKADFLDQPVDLGLHEKAMSIDSLDDDVIDNSVSLQKKSTLQPVFLVLNNASFPNTIPPPSFSFRPLIFTAN